MPWVELAPAQYEMPEPVAYSRPALSTVYKPLDMFSLRQSYSLLAPLLDTEYGSATFIAVDEPATFEVRVSTTGLLIRPGS